MKEISLNLLNNIIITLAVGEIESLGLFNK